MPSFQYATSLNRSCIPDSNRDRAASGPPALDLAAPVAAAVIVWWILRNLERLAGAGDGQPPATPQPQPPVLDADQVAAAATAIRPILLGRTRSRRPGSSGGYYFRYARIERLQEAVPGVRLIDPKSMEQLVRGLPDDDGDAVQMLRQASASIQHLHQQHPIGRLFNVVGSTSVLHADPCALATQSTETLIKLKIATALVCLTWQELNGYPQQLCQEVKEECFALVAGQFVQNILAVACLFGDVSWCACHVKEALTIFDVLTDVLYNIQVLPLNRYDEVAGITSMMVRAFKGILEGTMYDIDGSEECDIHPATVVLIQVLEFFHDNRDMVQSVIAAEIPFSDLFSCWELKLEKDAEHISQDEKGGRYIFLLNNSYEIWQVMRRPGASFSDVELVSRLIAMIQRYRKSYFDECWVPLISSLLKGDYLKNARRSSLDEFTEGFVSISRCHMTWKVRPDLKYELRKEIKDVLVTPYEDFLRAIQANPSRLSDVVYLVKRVTSQKKIQNEYTVEQLEHVIERLYES